MISKSTATLFVVVCVTASHGLPKSAQEEKGFVPLKNYVQVRDQVAMESNLHNESVAAASDKAGRFGFPTYSTDVQNGNGVVPGLYGPVKLDIGGLVLGTIVGLGAFFILPKILQVVSGPYGGYKRSEDENQIGGSSFSDIARRVSESLETMHLDTSACLQRTICTTMQTPSLREGLIESITKSDMVKTLVAGTDWEKAVFAGDKGESCGAAFPKCPFTVDSVVKPVIKYLSTT